MVKAFTYFGKEVAIMENVPLWEKYSLTVSEAAQYFGIGEKKLRIVIANFGDADFLLSNGGRTLIKRKLFEKFIDETSSL